MDPIKINVEVNLGEATIDALRQIFSAPLFQPTAQTSAPSKPEKSEKPAKPTLQPQPEMTKTTGAENVDDPPPDDAPKPAPKSEPNPTEADARAAVKEARDRGVSPKAIKDYMKNAFGIATSVECPEELRAKLIEGLKKLAA